MRIVCSALVYSLVHAGLVVGVQCVDLPQRIQQLGHFSLPAASLSPAVSPTNAFEICGSGTSKGSKGAHQQSSMQKQQPKKQSPHVCYRFCVRIGGWPPTDIRWGVGLNSTVVEPSEGWTSPVFLCPLPADCAVALIVFFKLKTSTQRNERMPNSGFCFFSFLW